MMIDVIMVIIVMIIMIHVVMVMIVIMVMALTNNAPDERDGHAGRPDGPRSFANVAWACRGIVP